MRVPVTPEAVSSHTEWLAYTCKLRQSRTEQRDTHNIYKCVVGGMLRVRLLCKVRKFSPITRSRGDRSPSFSKQKSQYYTPGFIRGLWFYRRYRCSWADVRQRLTRPSYLFTRICVGYSAWSTLCSALLALRISPQPKTASAWPFLLLQFK